MSSDQTITKLSKILIDGMSTIPREEIVANNPKIYQVFANNIVENIKAVSHTPFGV